MSIKKLLLINPLLDAHKPHYQNCLQLAQKFMFAGSSFALASTTCCQKPERISDLDQNFVFGILLTALKKSDESDSQKNIKTAAFY